LLQAALSHGGAGGLSQAGDPAGLAALRVSLSHHLAATRGITADPAQIFVTSGIRQGIALAARVLLLPGRIVALENPVYDAARSIFALTGAELRPIAVDEQGLQSDDLPPVGATLLYLTPSHQFPTGHTLSLARRQAIADWGLRVGCYLLEDDCDGDYRFEDATLPAVASIAPECTIYLGGVRKSLGAGVRLGTWSYRQR
jgi:GntR family transcriptional regulator / MocR family aminotransferase